MFVLSILGLAVSLQGALAQCNGVDVGLGSKVPLGYCVGTRARSQEGGYKFECASTSSNTATLFLYDNVDCSGTPIETTERIDGVDSIVVCDGTDCDPLIYTHIYGNYTGSDWNSTDCDPDSLDIILADRYPLVVDDCAPVWNGNATHGFGMLTCSEGEMTFFNYSSSDCSGSDYNVTVTSGCQSGYSYDEYVDIKCPGDTTIATTTESKGTTTTTLEDTTTTIESRSRETTMTIESMAAGRFAGLAVMFPISMLLADVTH